MKKNYVLLTFLCCLTVIFSYSQDNIANPNVIIKATDFKIIPPLSQQVHKSPQMVTKEVNNNRWLNYPTNFDAYPKGEDVLRQREAGYIRAFDPLVNIDGATVGVHSGSNPPDPTGAVGPNHYIHAYNSGFVIYDKSGTVLLNHASLAMIWPGETTGDPIVLYDRYADRFIITQFDASPNALLFAISQGPDPVNDGWFTYSFGTGGFPDYPHYSIWHDAYYATVNKNTGPGFDQVYAFERDKLLIGDPAAQIVGFEIPNVIENSVMSSMAMNSVGPLLPDASLPAYVVYLQDDGWAGGVDRLKIWEVDMDWVTTANSTISAPIEIPTTPYDSFVAPFGTGEVPQPGTGQRIDGITGLMSFPINYYNFGGTNSATLNFNTDVNGDNTVLGIRWFELQETAGVWSIAQEGTFAPDDGLYRFMGSMSMDANGNIALAYSVANETTFPSLRYTGRWANSPANQMVLQEKTIVAGGGSMTGSNRFGDYSHMTLDPSDNTTFWFSSEYVNTTNQWRTRISSFSLVPVDPDDVGVTVITQPNDATLSATESITVEVFNFGTDSQSNIPVWYQIDGGAMIMETYPGPLASVTSDTYTFTTTADLSNEGQVYSITASTNLAGDSDSANDAVTKQVEHLAANDLGVTSINTPLSGIGLGATESIEVTVENFGGVAQSNFDVSYSINGSPVTEQVAGPLNSGATTDYTFTATGDFSAIGLYSMSAGTSLGGDSDNSNDSVSSNIYHAGCLPEPNDCSFDDGVILFELGTISDAAPCTGNGYVDRTNLNTDLDRNAGSNPHVGNLQVGFNGDEAIMWIDFNDDGDFDDPGEEVYAPTVVPVAGADTAFNINLPVDANLGTHVMRVKGWDPAFGGDNTPCGAVQYGRVQDYTVTITDSALNIDDFALKGAEFEIYDRGDNNFEVVLKPTGFTDQLVITMHNVLGENLVKNRVYYENGQYRYMLKLNGLASGVYLVRLGTNQFGRVKRIIVK
jgi:hypothetical protein